MSISMSLKLTEKSKRWLRKFPLSFKKGFIKGMRDSIRLAEKAAKQNAPVKTGTLRRSIRSEIEEQGFETVGNLFSNLIYSRVIEEGGYRNIKAQPYLEPAIRENLPTFEDRIEKAIEKEVNLKHNIK